MHGCDEKKVEMAIAKIVTGCIEKIVRDGKKSEFSLSVTCVKKFRLILATERKSLEELKKILFSALKFAYVKNF
jgi:hypothetical protein